MYSLLIKLRETRLTFVLDGVTVVNEMDLGTPVEARRRAVAVLRRCADELAGGGLGIGMLGGKPATDSAS